MSALHKGEIDRLTQPERVEAGAIGEIVIGEGIQDRRLRRVHLNGAGVAPVGVPVERVVDRLHPDATVGSG
jgi:hypothetical protein